MAEPWTEAGARLEVTVVVPVRNDRGGHLRALISALSRQTLPRERFEVVIGNDGSTDDSFRDLETTDGWVRVVHGPPRCSYAARNMAAAAARPSRAFAFVDSDCVPEPDWLEQGLAALEHAHAVAGQIRFAPPERRSIWALVDVETTKDHELQVKNGNAETANFFVRREVFEQLDGFDDSLPEHGDFDFARRCVEAGLRLDYAPDATVAHPARTTAKSFFKMVWVMHRWYAAREVRARRRPLGLTLRWWVPVALHVRWRRHAGRSVLLDRRWLGRHGLRPRVRDQIVGVPLLYLVIPYFAGAAQARGWLDGRRLR